MTSPARALGLVVILVLAAELAIWEAFLVPLRGFGTSLPVAAVFALLGNVLVARAGAVVWGSRVGAVLPGVVWLGLALTLGTRTAAGDLIVVGTGMGVAFLVAGTIGAVLGAATAPYRPSVQNRA